jgi:hypothetical protein
MLSKAVSFITFKRYNITPVQGMKTKKKSFSVKREAGRKGTLHVIDNHIRIGVYGTPETFHGHEIIQLSLVGP